MTPIEAEVLYWASQGENDLEISNTKKRGAKDRVPYSEASVRNIRLSAEAALRPFRFDTPERKESVRQAIILLVGDPPRFDPWPPTQIEEPVIEPEQSEQLRGQLMKNLILIN
jgi:hypothetical protein